MVHSWDTAQSQYCPFGDASQMAYPKWSPGGHPLRGREGSRPSRPVFFLGMGEQVQIQARGYGNALFRGHTTAWAPGSHLGRIPNAPTPRIVLSLQPRLHFPRCSGVHMGGAHLGCGGRDRHVPSLSANAEPCREVTCRCLALLCAPWSVGAQSVARRLGLSRWVRTSVRRRWAARGTRPAGGAKPWQWPPAGGRQAGLRAPEGLEGGGRSALCVAQAEPRLCPCSLGARLLWGGGAAN